MDKAQIIGSIITGGCDDFLSDIGDAVRQRRSARVAATPFRVGQKVRLQGLNPKYINGAVCTVMKVNPKKLVVSFPDGAQYGRFSGSRMVSVPKASCESVEADVYEVD